MEDAVAGGEQRRRLTLAAAIDEGLVLAPVGQHLDELHARRVVELQLDVGAAEAVVLGRVRQVVPGAVVLDHRPGLPLRGEAALGAGRNGLLRHLAQLRPGLRRLVRVETRLLHQLLVPVEHRRRGVERHRQQLAVRRGVIAIDRADIGLGVERLLGVGHELIDRIDGALGGHHVRGADLEHLHDVRRLLGTEGRDRRRQGLGIGALVDRVHLVLGLGLVEAVGQGADRIAQIAAHGVPELDFGLRQGSLCARQNRRNRDGRKQNPCHIEQTSR